ncbi:MAG: hypothetical protein P4L35_18790 [Ignavibacteriaceae bacterium]|nr:hypothetical protein [Ignavibacteriaceae bacterium]
MNEFYFPFGERLKKVQQKDRTPKKAFVLGVYASAVHARWVDRNGRQKVAALAVASEPNIFWTGEEASEIISGINIPKELGKLTEPLDPKLNGPSGRALNDLFLKPLDLTRDNTWLCDLLPESRVNENQAKAIIKHYTADIIHSYNLCEASIPLFSKSELNSQIRRQEILEELISSSAETLILLGDLPIYWFLRFYDKKYTRLLQFGDMDDSYGREHEIRIEERIYNVIPLCHPRQAQRLGNSNTKWGGLHDNWVKRRI